MNVQEEKFDGLRPRNFLHLENSKKKEKRCYFKFLPLVFDLIRPTFTPDAKLFDFPTRKE